MKSQARLRLRLPRRLILSARYCVQCHRGSREVELLWTSVCVDCRDKNLAWFRENYPQSSQLLNPKGAEL